MTQVTQPALMNPREVSQGVPEAATGVAGPRRRRPWLPRSWQFRVGGTLVLGLVTVVLVGPLVAPHSPTEFIGAPYSAGVPGSLVGTDGLGRDVLSRFLHGGGTVMLMAVCSALLGVGAGALVALFAGYAGERVDNLVMRVVDVVIAFPSVVLALLLLSITGPSAVTVVAAVAASYAPRSARILRSAIKGVAQMEYVQAAELAGARRWHIRLSEILPNVLGPLMVEFGLRLTYAVALVASLSFLGFGLQPPTADWGLMINENRMGMGVQPWAVLLPVLGIAVLSVGANLLTDGVARAVTEAKGTDQ